MQEQLKDDNNSFVNQVTATSLAERASEKKLLKQIATINDNPLINSILQAFNGIVMIINKQRQLLAANVTVLDKIELSDDKLFGSRLGEVLGCINAKENQAGCGNSEYCSVCNALNATLNSQNQKKICKDECSITVNRNGQNEDLDFSILATPLTIEGFEFTIICLQDISDKKRREALENVFFHDVLNTIGGIRGWSQLLEEHDPQKMRQTVSQIQNLSTRLLGEVKGQQAIMLAEKGRFMPAWSLCKPNNILQEIEAVFKHHECAEGKKLKIVTKAEAQAIISDRILVMRILTNMVKNAFEASREGEEIKVCYEISFNHCKFSIHNPAYINPAIGRKLFQRSFSTKADSNRGLGTYSMKLFGEACLGGKVFQTSFKNSGTTFFLELPLRPDDPDALKLIETQEQSKQKKQAKILIEAGLDGISIQGKKIKSENLLYGYRFLVADDVTMMRKLIASYLENCGGMVVEASNGEKVIEALTEAKRNAKPFDLLVLDLLMPKKSGLEILAVVRDLPETKSLPVIILSSERDKNKILKCVDLGISGYLVKPVEKAVLIEIILQQLDINKNK